MMGIVNLGGGIVIGGKKCYDNFVLRKFLNSLTPKKIVFVILITIIVTLGIYYLFTTQKTKTLNLNTLPPLKQNDSILVLESSINTRSTHTVFYEIFAKEKINIKIKEVSAILPDSNKVILSSEVSPDRHLLTIIGNPYCYQESSKDWTFLGTSRKYNLNELSLPKNKIPVFYIVYEDTLTGKTYYSKYNGGGTCSSLIE